MEPKITKKLVEEHGISAEEYKRILSILSREPTITELGIFSVMWSEHASYKNSIKLIKTLPTTGKVLLTKTGEENAGVVDIGDGLGIVFKIESHNHPSAIEPYQGAATGVGGILRDIFTMGARPIAILNSLRFGELQDSQNKKNTHTQHLFAEVVKGIGDYGNCVGVSTVGGEVYFEECYKGNPLVNAMTVGVVRHENLATASAKGPGNYVIYVGSATGRDGIHGATFASANLSEESTTRRTSVQVGDPFVEKLLLEATLEAIEKKLIVGVQDMGAAGLTCSTSEMAAKAGTGMDIDVALVPQREKDMTPYEIMLSESQERMLLVVTPENFDKVKKIYEKWDLHVVRIGNVTDDKMLRVRNRGKIVAEIPAAELVLGGGAPVYTRETKYPEYLDRVHSFSSANLPGPENYNEILAKLLTSPNIASKNYVYQQYDYMVRINTLVEPGSDAAVCRIKDTQKAIAITTDCSARYCHLDPYEGAKGAVAEAARNIVCAGGNPLAITNCLNFGNPYNPEVYWTFSEVIRGMGEACNAFDTPVTGGNVSFYNETEKSAVYPTPVIGMVGLLEDIKYTTTQYFKNAGDLIVLLGDPCNEVGGSEYLKLLRGKVAGRAPKVDLAYEINVQEVCKKAIRAGIVNSAHDCSEGGLAVAIAESCFNPESRFGADIQFEMSFRTDFEIFGESHSRIILSIPPGKLEQLQEIAQENNVRCTPLGTVAKDQFTIGSLIKMPIEKLYELWYHSIENTING